MDINCFDCLRISWMTKTYFLGERGFCYECYHKRICRNPYHVPEDRQKEQHESLTDCNDLKGQYENN